MRKSKCLALIPFILGLTACNDGGVVGSSGNATANTTQSDMTAPEFNSSMLQESSPSLLSFMWVGGSNKVDESGVYSKTQGAVTAGATPGDRIGFNMSRDLKGNIWVFGGNHAVVNPTIATGYYNDLWVYSNGAWTWIKGSNVMNADGVYGTKGTSAAANTPGARGNAFDWTDESGNFWVFGGIISKKVGTSTVQAVYNDLWKFDTNLKQWTWVSGSNLSYQKSVYGSIGQESASFTPGARFNTDSTWTTPGYLWLFGGVNSESDPKVKTPTQYNRNDLWRFNTKTRMWALMTESSTAKFYDGSGGNIAAGVYGIYGVESSGNTPPGYSARTANWKDKSGNFWLLGSNDLWRYNPNKRQWAWMGGSKLSPTASGSVPVYGSIGVESASFSPGGRTAATYWTDSNGYFWLQGGFGMTSSSTSGYFADVWRYDTSTNQWAFMGGSKTLNVTVNFGTKQVAASTNFIGSRWYSSAVAGESGVVWVFSGRNTSNYLYADLWTITAPLVDSLSLTKMPESQIKWRDALTDIPVGKFGLVGYILNNNSGYSIESIGFNNMLPSSEFGLDYFRSTCFNYQTKQSIVLPTLKSCTMVFKYQPIYQGEQGVWNFGIQAYKVGSTLELNTIPLAVPYYSRVTN